MAVTPWTCRAMAFAAARSAPSPTDPDSVPTPLWADTPSEDAARRASAHRPLRMRTRFHIRNLWPEDAAGTRPSADLCSTGRAG